MGIFSYIRYSNGVDKFRNMNNKLSNQFFMYVVRLYQNTDRQTTLEIIKTYQHFRG